MKVCIAEKKSAASDIAKILGANVSRDGYFEGNGWQVTWAAGHLCGLKDPGDYTDLWKRWSLGQLPMIPERFAIKEIDDRGKQRQLNVIRQLTATATEVVNCGDAGQEGELIQRWIMQKVGVKCPVKRLWISSLTDEAIRDGFNDLRPQSEFDNLYLAGLARAIGDWLLGMNATRLYSLKCSSPGNVLSIGRVQTPTLALIVERHKEIQNFVPTDYWELKTVYRDTTFNAVKGRFATEEEANEACARIAGNELTITGVEEKKGREAPPRLFDLTSLQVECNKKWGWTADETLSLIQSLYEKKVTTYPRVDTTYLTDDLYPKIPGILQKMTPYAPLTAPVLAAKLPKSKKVFDNAKVTDHHAIIPTGQVPTSLVGNERKLYHLIALRFIAAFYPDCRFLSTTVTASIADIPFKATGKVITDPGWRVIYAKNNDSDADDANRDEENILPQFTVGEHGPHTPSLLKKTTQPPKYYNEGTLLRAMESAGKNVDDEELREAMKENGIGRPSTRAAIIETLYKRHYIYRERKNIMAAPAGIQLIETINEEMIKSVKLTGIWESKLRQIERGRYSPAEFIDQLKQMISAIVYNVLSDNTLRRIEVVGPNTKGKKGDDSAPSSATNDTPKPPKPRAPRVTRLEQIVCPKCGQGHIIKGRTAYGCSRFREGCDMLLSFDRFAADLTPGKLNAAIKKQFKKS
ncbi:MAG: DNA topoisomerase 3 [Muribaculaceae bacterium]|nr:DNA topoisomerase 3 [Muribaculaceae bacterium]